MRSDKREREVEVVIDDHDRHFVPQLVEGHEELLDHRRREAFERLVEQQHPRVAGQRARHRDHLLLAARKIVGRRAQRALMRGKNSKIVLVVPGNALRRCAASAAPARGCAHAHAGEERRAPAGT